MGFSKQESKSGSEAAAALRAEKVAAAQQATEEKAAAALKATKEQPDAETPTSVLRAVHINATGQAVGSPAKAKGVGSVTDNFTAVITQGDLKLAAAKVDGFEQVLPQEKHEQKPRPLQPLIKEDDCQCSCSVM